MTQVGEIKTKRIIWMSPDTTLEEKNESFCRKAHLLELEDNFKYFGMSSKKLQEYNQEGVHDVLKTIVYQAHLYAMKKTFNLSREEQSAEREERGYNLYMPYIYSSRKEAFGVLQNEKKSYQLEVRYDNGRLKKKAHLDEIIRYRTETISDRDKTEVKKDAILATLKFIGYNGNARFLEHTEVSTTARPQEIAKTKSLKAEKFMFEGEMFSYGEVQFEDENPFVKDELLVSIRLNIPSFGFAGDEITDEFDIVTAKNKKLELAHISNYGMEIKVQGIHNQPLSAEEFDFYFKELLLDHYAFLEKKFRDYYTLHSTIVKNFFADFLGIKGGKLPKIFKQFKLNALWADENMLKDDGDKDLMLMSHQELDKMYHPRDYEFDYTWNNEKFGDLMPSIYLDYFENADKMFPAIGRKTVVSCGNFMEGVTGQVCDINLMKQINATEDEDNLDAFFE